MCVERREGLTLNYKSSSIDVPLLFRSYNLFTYARRRKKTTNETWGIEKCNCMYSRNDYYFQHKRRAQHSLWFHTISSRFFYEAHHAVVVCLLVAMWRMFEFGIYQFEKRWRCLFVVLIGCCRVRYRLINIPNKFIAI